jgi:hypothetical protein
MQVEKEVAKQVFCARYARRPTSDAWGRATMQARAGFLLFESLWSLLVFLFESFWAFLFRVNLVASSFSFFVSILDNLVASSFRFSFLFFRRRFFFVRFEITVTLWFSYIRHILYASWPL